MTAPEQYLVSVIIPAHNVGPYIERTVNSLLGQTLGDKVEIILVENGSSDDTPEICLSLAEKHATVKALVSPTRGPGNARNFGLRHATGKYVGFVDGDDYVDPTMYETLVKTIEETGADSSWCNFRFVCSDSCKPPKDEKPASDTGQVTTVDAVDATFDILTDRTTSSPCTRLFYREFFNTHSFPENQLFEDHAVIYRWIADCNKIAHIDRVLYYYCLRDGSTTQAERNISRQTDLMESQLGRLKFIDSYNGFTPQQRWKARNVAIRYAIFIMKSYIYQTEDTTEEYDNALHLRDMLLSVCNYTPRQIKFSIWFRMMRIRYGWNRYYPHLARKKGT